VSTPPERVISVTLALTEVSNQAVRFRGYTGGSDVDVGPGGSYGPGGSSAGTGNSINGVPHEGSDADNPHRSDHRSVDLRFVGQFGLAARHKPVPNPCVLLRANEMSAMTGFLPTAPG